MRAVVSGRNREEVCELPARPFVIPLLEPDRSQQLLGSPIFRRNGKSGAEFLHRFLETPQAVITHRQVEMSENVLAVLFQHLLKLAYGFREASCGGEQDGSPLPLVFAKPILGVGT